MPLLPSANQVAGIDVSAEDADDRRDDLADAAAADDDDAARGSRSASRGSSQRFHAPPLHRAPHGPLGAGQGCIDGGIQRCVPALEHHAGQTGQNDLESARLIDAASRPVQIVYANTDPLYGARVFPESAAELAPDVVALDGPELGLGGPYVDRKLL